LTIQAKYLPNPQTIRDTTGFASIIVPSLMASFQLMEWIILCIAADWAATSLPFLQASTMKDMLTEDGGKASRFVHAFQAYRTGW